MSEEDGGGGMGKFGAMLGRGAAKAGKKAAQSEAGKRATKAAVKGACDGVRDDMITRYGGDEPISPTATTPAATPTSTTTPPSETKCPDSPYDHSSDRELYREYYSQKTSGGGGRSSAPPKPSFFNKINFMKKKSDDSAIRRRPRTPVDPKNRIYKHRLAKTPDWDKLQLVQALYNFKGEMNCDLQFRKGQVIKIITRTESQEDWWEGKIDDRVGIFPANYVKIM